MSSLDDYLSALMRLNEATAQKQALKNKLIPAYIFVQEKGAKSETGNYDRKNTNQTLVG